MHPNDGRVLSNSIVQALRGEEITIYGSAQQVLSFCCADEIVDVLILIMNSTLEITSPLNLEAPVNLRCWN
jgi:UDP-glucuronate decarboxylase